MDRVKPGDRVMVSLFTSWLDGPLQPAHFGTDLGGGCDGTLAELAAFPASSLVAIPDSLSDEEAACLPCAGLTAWVSLVEFGQMKAGDTVLLLGTGGVSIFGLQLARMMGADAVITSSSDDKLDRARALGATHGINYRDDPNWGHNGRRAHRRRRSDHRDRRRRHACPEYRSRCLPRAHRADRHAGRGRD